MPTLDHIIDSKTGIKYDLQDTTARNSISSLNSQMSNKVTKEDGKGLSSNDFTDVLKEKLEGLKVVTANPDEEATGSLTKLKIGDTVLEVTGGGSGGSGGDIENAITTNVEVGGIPSGTKFAAGTSIESILNKMLVKYKNPTVTLSINASSPRAKWNPLPSITLTANATKGTNNIKNIVLYAGSTSIKTLDTSGSFTYTANISTDTTFKAIVSDTENKTGESSKSITFLVPYYYGANAATSVSALTGFTEDISAKGNKTYKFTASEQYLYFIYDSSYADLTSISDSTGNENIGNFEKLSNMTITASDGKDYTFKVYRTKTVQTLSNFSLTFK